MTPHNPSDIAAKIQVLEDLVHADPPENLSEMTWLRSQDAATDITTIAQALNCGAVPGLYMTRIGMVHLSPGATREKIQPVTAPLMGALLAEHVYMTKRLARKGGVRTVRIHPTRSIIAQTLAGTDWPGIPPLRRLVPFPTLCADGTVLLAPGYDPASGTYHDPRPGADYSDLVADPTPSQIREARRFIGQELFPDFPWSSQADRANCLALLCTPALRDYIGTDAAAQTPFGIVSSRDGGANRRLLADLICEPFQGSSCAVGTSIQIDLSNAACGKPGFGRVAAARSVPVRLGPESPRPDLREWIGRAENQAGVVAASLILARSWAMAGAPRIHTRMYDFSAWASAMAGLLDYHGVSGFLGNMEWPD